MSEPTMKQRIEAELQQHPLVLYMKGTADFPMCGFSGKVVHILKSYGVDFHTVDILQDNAIRQGLKEYANWPTIPQFYIKGQFIGGCDILEEMHENGELKAALSEFITTGTA